MHIDFKRRSPTLDLSFLIGIISGQTINSTYKIWNFIFYVMLNCFIICTVTTLQVLRIGTACTSTVQYQFCGHTSTVLVLLCTFWYTCVCRNLFISEDIRTYRNVILVIWCMTLPKAFPTSKLKIGGVKARAKHSHHKTPSSSVTHNIDRLLLTKDSFNKKIRHTLHW